MEEDPSSSDSKNVPDSSLTIEKVEDARARFQEIDLLRKPSEWTTSNTIVISEAPTKIPKVQRERRRGELLHQCLPISCMKLFNESLLVVSEGPCLLLHHPKLKQQGHGNKCRRIQIFPNQLTITGIEFVEDSCGYPARKSVWNGQEEQDAMGFVWAGNHGIFITLNRQVLEIPEVDTFPMNQESYLALNYIPICARWFENGKILVLLSVFNYIVIYERTEPEDGIKGLKEVGKYECEPENLYSGTMYGDQLDELIVFSGTTFKGILIWDIKDGIVNIRHKLMGHQGIPFSLDYNNDCKVLLSSSDDRTVIAWAFVNEDQGMFFEEMPKEIDESFLIAQEKIHVQPGIPVIAKRTHRLRGHEARVWKSIWIKHAKYVFMVSVGEDSWVRMNGYDNMSTKFWKAHDGASIYQIAYDSDEDFLYTGAHDGSIFIWKRFYLRTQPIVLPFDKIPVDKRTEGMYTANKYNRSISNHDYPRGIALWDSNFVIASMNEGRVISFYYFNQKQSHLYYDVRFKGYSILSVSRQRSLVAVGGVMGDFVLLAIFLQDDPINPRSRCQRLYAQKAFEFKFEGKILNIIWVANDQAFVVCIEKAYLLYLFYGNKEKKELCGRILATYPLALDRPGIPAAIQIAAQFIIAGDESGDLMLFHIGATGKDLDLLQTIKKVHGEGVTSIIEYKSKIMTAGKFGGIKTFVLQGEGSETRLVKVHECTIPFEWVAKMVHMQERYEDLLIGGFHKKTFVIYSWNEKRILNEVTDVGGGYRRWDFKFEYGNAALTFIRDNEIYYSTTNIEDRVENVLKPGLHHKTINCGINLLKKEKNLFVATGSEDTCIRIFRYNLEMNKYYPIHEIKSHGSSVRALASLEIDNQRCILFSGGGRSELIATLVGLDVEELEVYGKISLVKPKNRDTEIDTRIMDLAVTKFQIHDGEKDGIVCFCACSDGSIRALIFSIEKKKFVIVSVLSGNGHSLMKIQLIKNSIGGIMVFGVTSNGCLLIWKWKSPQDELNFKSHNNKEPELVQSIYTNRIRKAAVMSLKITANSAENSSEYFMAIGSDDCCTSLWKLKLSEDIEIEELWHEDQSQRGAVIGVQIVDNLIFSCSNDQVIAKFDMSGNLLGKSIAGVPDCQGFIVSHLEDCIMCYGDGVTWISCP